MKRSFFYNFWSLLLLGFFLVLAAGSGSDGSHGSSSYSNYHETGSDSIYEPEIEEEEIEEELEENINDFSTDISEDAREEEEIYQSESDETSEFEEEQNTMEE